MTAEIWNTYELVVVSGTSFLIGAVPAIGLMILKRWDGSREVAVAQGWWRKALAVQEANDRARWAPAYREVEAEPNADDHVSGEIVAEQVHEPLALSDRPAEDEDEIGDEQPGEAMSYAGPRLIERLWDWLFGVMADIRDLFKSAEQRAAEFWDTAEEEEPTPRTHPGGRLTPWEREDNPPPGRGRHWRVGELDHPTGTFPVVAPAQRTEAE